jgi:hypothetical protein
MSFLRRHSTKIALVAAMLASPSAGSATEKSEPVQLPTNVRNDVAVHIVSEYVKDAVGHATISKPWNGAGLLGSNSSILICYPVRDTGFFASHDGTRMRCIKVEMERGLATGDEGIFSVTRSRTDGEGCHSYEETMPYVELERMAARLKACQAKGVDRCLLTTTMPEAQARKLMNQR